MTNPAPTSSQRQPGDAAGAHTPVRLAVVGAGGRGSVYAGWAHEHPDLATVVAVADPRAFARDRIGDQFGLPGSARLADWRDLLQPGAPEADAVLICTQDRDHHDPAVAFGRAGYNVLLEKPIAPTEPEVREVIDAVRAGGGQFAVCHVMRYTPYTKAVKAVVDSGRLGRILDIQHLEPVGYWHFAHSYVRGNWRRAQDSSSMLMAKSSHDIDWIRYIVGQPYTRISSFGRLSYFRPESAPDGAGDRCVSCPVESSCQFSAVRIYRQRLGGWPSTVVCDTQTEEALDEALRTGPYGRCVYKCDNDVADHQVVSMEFADGATGTFTVTGLSPRDPRRTRIFGTDGYLEGDTDTITVTDYLTDHSETVYTADQDAEGGHSGGDAGLMSAFVAAIAGAGDPGRPGPSPIASGPDESLESHLAVFAAERARANATVETIEMSVKP
jgi:predicted dehydrogenase